MTATARERLAAMLAEQDALSSSVQLTAKNPADLQVEVEGIGQLSLPVTPDLARRLCELGHPARFGRGEETLTDPMIRDTCEIPTELVHIEWAGGLGLGPDLDAVREELGLPKHCRLTADLHSMLVYTKGQFFLPHQDSEKDDAMIATLVVTLPSAHTGGELVIHHLGEATTYRGWKDRIALVAFYADCRHEVRPVKTGHRIALTYNLLLSGDPADRASDQATIGELARQLGAHFTTRVQNPYRDETSDPPDRLVALLDHEYTARSLGWQKLKGTDASRAALLRAAANVAGCEAVLALTEINETWNAIEPYPDYRYGRWDRAPAGPAATDDYEVTDLIDSSIRLTRWTDPTGGSAEDISLAVNDDEVCTATPSSSLKPYESEYEGYMGNYGNTLDLWYRRAAVVVWPRERSFTNRAQASPSWAMDNLLEQARGGDLSSARAAAATLAPFWDAAVHRHERPGPLLTKSLAAAIALDDANAAAKLLHPFTIESLSRTHMASLARLAKRYGERWTGDLLRVWFAGRSGWMNVHGTSRSGWLTSLPALCTALQSKGNPGDATAHHLLELAWGSLTELINSGIESPSPIGQRERLERLGEPLAALIAGAETIEASDLRDRIVGYCQQQGDALSGCVILALRDAAKATQTRPDGAFAQLAADQLRRLRDRLAQPARAADDWAMELPDGCACDLCGTLRSFLTDPDRQKFEWPLAKDRRSHLHSRIDRAELPVSHQTRRQGRPFTLVLTKTVQLFEREAQQRARDQTDLDWLHPW